MNMRDSPKQRMKLPYMETLKLKKVFTTDVVNSKVERNSKKESCKQATSKGQTTPVDASSKPCMYCKGEQHNLCRKLKSKPHKDKIDFLKNKGLCFACLKHGHMSSSCKDKLQCQECSRLHPTLLHFCTKEPQEETSTETCDQQSVSSAFVQVGKIVFFQSFQCV